MSRVCLILMSLCGLHGVFKEPCLTAPRQTHGWWTLDWDTLLTVPTGGASPLAGVSGPLTTSPRPARSQRDRLAAAFSSWGCLSPSGPHQKMTGR